MSDLPIYDSLAVAEKRGLVNLTALASCLDRKRGTVHMWAKRRRTTKFPMPVATYRAGSRILFLWDLLEVIEWHTAYVPSTGGAPIGNRNWVPKRDKMLTGDTP